jgi:hypothetical protein
MVGDTAATLRAVPLQHYFRVWCINIRAAIIRCGV